MDLLNQTVLLKTKSTLFNLLIWEASHFLCHERLLNMTYVAYKKMHFSAKCNSGRIAIQWFHIKHYLDYQYTKFQPYNFRVQKMCVLHDTRLWFPDYNTVQKCYWPVNGWLRFISHFKDGNNICKLPNIRK